MAVCQFKSKNVNEESDYNAFNLFEPTNRSTVPKINEWEQLWCAWDVVSGMINHDTMLLEQPIGLRHPFIFYIGHIPAFLDIMLTRHKVDSMIYESPSLTVPAKFTDIFERGIDPDMDDPNICNPHSLVHESETGWPNVEFILQFQDVVRSRLRRLLKYWEANGWTTCRQMDGKVVWMCFEHEAMHLETLLYMLVQSPNFKHPSVPPPLWYTQNDQHGPSNSPLHLDRARMISFDGGNVEIGLDERNVDFSANQQSELLNFGWDNEQPKRAVFVSPFELQSRPVTNGEYWDFWKKSNYDEVLLPAAWHFRGDHSNDELPKVKTSFGLCEFHSGINWPVQVSCQQAEAYSSTKGMRLPTEPEWILFRSNIEAQLSQSERSQNFVNLWNYGFKSWTPQPLNNERVHLLGDVWEWTSSVWNHYEGFIPSDLYPGYSADFFDGKHRVVLGASWATHPRIAERVSFRNWYQWRYPYVFCGFRLCKSL